MIAGDLSKSNQWYFAALLLEHTLSLLSNEATVNEGHSPCTVGLIDAPNICSAERALLGIIEDWVFFNNIFVINYVFTSQYYTLISSIIISIDCHGQESYHLPPIWFCLILQHWGPVMALLQSRGTPASLLIEMESVAFPFVTLDLSRLFLCSWNAAGLFSAGKTNNEIAWLLHDQPLLIIISV